MKKLLTLISLLLSLFSAAQVAPLDVSIQLLPPYSICLPDLAAPGSDRLRIQVVQRDLMTASYDFFLVLEVEHQGRTLMRTATHYRPAVNVTPGRILVLSGAVVAPYLEEQNLDFLGYSRDLYRRNQTIPEGLVTIKATAYDYYRPTQRVSSTAQTSAWLARADPPLLQTPANGLFIPAMSDLHPVVFSWLPRNMASPNSALQTTYRLELFELMVEGDSPDRVARSQPPIYERELAQTSYSYGANDPRLTLGKTYAWRVKAADRSGRDLFANNGYSPVFSFTYGYDPAVAPLPPVTGVQVATKANTATVTWQGHPDHRYYVVEMKCEDCSGWITADSTDQRRMLLAPLSYGVMYEVRVTARNELRSSPTTTPVSFTCTEQPAVPCGEADGATAPPIDYTSPLLHTLPYDLEVTDKKAIRYTIKGSELNPDGSFSGGAVMYINLGHPGGIPVRVAFKNLRVNQLLQVVDGSFHFVTAEGGMADGDKHFEGGATGSGRGVTAADVTLNLPLSEESIITVAQGSAAGTLALTITQSDGSSQTVEVPAPANAQPGNDEDGNPEQPDLTGTTVQDSKGNTFSLQPNGSGGYTPTPIGTQGPPPAADYTLLQNTLATVTFDVEKPEDKPFLAKFEGAYTVSLLMGERHQRIAYAERKDGRQYYYAPILSVNPSKSITLRAKVNLESSDIHPDSIFFATKDGERLAARHSGEYVTLTVASGTSDESRRYYALCPRKDGAPAVVGAFEVVTYHAETVNVALVPVNDFGKDINTEELQAYLNKTYAPANISFKLSKEANFSYGGNLKLLENKSGLLDAYTDDMKAFNSEYMSHVGSSFKKDALYLFFANYGFGGEKFAAGFMPRQQQLGYIFIAEASQDLYRIVAHELGHGAANLAHTFDKTKYGIAQGSTQNLMDYSNGTELVKLQWDALHDRGEVWRMFESDEDGMAIQDDLNMLLQYLAHSQINSFALAIKCPSAAQSSNERGYRVSPEGGSIRVNIKGESYHVFFMKYDYVDSKLKITSIDFDEKSIPQGSVSVEGITIPPTADKFIMLNKQMAEDKTTPYFCFDLKEDYSKICEAGAISIQADNDLYRKIGADIMQCSTNLNLPSNGLTLAEITATLQSLKQQMRSNQQVEFTQNGAVYALNANNQAEVVHSPESEDAINSGSWSDDKIEVKARVNFNDEGVLQIAALGIRSNLTCFKTTDVKALSTHIRSQSNAFLQENRVTKVDQSYADETNDAFADGEKIVVKSKVWRIISEGVGISTTLVKTGKVEEAVYQASTKGSVVIHAPGVVTGTVEAAAKTMTDITQLVSMVYDLVVDKQARTDAYNGLVALKNEVKENPSQLFSILSDIILEEATGNTPEDWAEISNDNTDRGRKGHLITKGSVRTAVTVIVSGKIIAELPKIADNVTKKITRKKLLKVVTRGVNFDDFKKATMTQINKVVELGNNGQKFIEELWESFVKQDLDGVKNTYRKFDLDPNTMYPPNNGAWNMSKKTLKEGELIDRYGSPAGTFASPASTPVSQRSLSAEQRSLTPQKYKIIKEIPVEEGQVIPWFREEGLGIQYHFEKDLQWYIDREYIEMINY